VTASPPPRSAGPKGIRGLPLIVALALAVTLLGVVFLAGSVLGYRAGAWHLGLAIGIMRVGSWICLVGALFSVLAATMTRPGTPYRGFALSVATALIGGAGFAVLLNWWSMSRGEPAIHDITTDVANPPAFVAVLPLRAQAANSAVYGGPDVAAKQHEAYPDIGPMDIAIAPGPAFAASLVAARGVGWEIVAADSAAGRIEATATSAWFGFKSDIVVRVAPTDHGSRVDVRSESRDGASDGGSNARLIRRFLARLQQAV
jgi:uncharacterized protein (DUF1499 family)